MGAKQGETVRYGLENNIMEQRETRGMCQCQSSCLSGHGVELHRSRDKKP